MGKKVNHFTVIVKGEEVVIKRCTGCDKDKALSDYSKGVALFGRQAKCKACYKKDYALEKMFNEFFIKETDEQRHIISFIQQRFPFVRYTGCTQTEATDFINLFILSGKLNLQRGDTRLEKYTVSGGRS